jgi:hypothetical protein
VIAIAVVAYAACDMTHEVLGHGVACLMAGVRPLSLSTVALQTGISDRWVAAAGSIANGIAGVVAFLWLRRRTVFDALTYFLWLFGATNLLNGTGYLMFSGLLGIGDWSVVVAGLEPQTLWRGALAIAGVVLYVAAIRWIAARAISFVRQGLLSRHELQRLVFPAYVAGGLLFVAGSALNRIDPMLILTSGVSSGFAAMAGLVVVPGIVERRTQAFAPVTASPLSFHLGCVIAGAVVALLFVAILGPGVRLS